MPTEQVGELLRIPEELRRGEDATEFLRRLVWIGTSRFLLDKKGRRSKNCYWLVLGTFHRARLTPFPDMGFVRLFSVYRSPFFPHERLWDTHV